MTTTLTRRQKVALLKALKERHRRREARRLLTDRAGIEANCTTLYGFIQEFWYVLEPARPFVGGWALRAMCAHLEAVTRGQILRLLITVPPGMMKSLVLVFWSAWEWGPKDMAHTQYLATSFSQPNVLRDNSKLRRLIESEKYRALWGQATKLRHDQNAKGKFENISNGFSEARPFSAMTGGRGDRLKVDDPHSVDSAESDQERKNTVTTFREALPDRLNDMQTSVIVIIMQRLHTEDVAGTILALGFPYVHLCLPMEFEEERIGDDGKVTGGPCRTYINGELFFEDPRTTEGELLFPERFPQSAVDSLKAEKGPYAYAGQYQQRPTPRDGGMFQRQWFEGKTLREPPLGTTWVRYWDLAGTELKKGATRGARTAGVKMGRTHDGRYIVGHCVVAAKEGGAVRKLVKATAEVDGKSIEIGISQDPGQAGKDQVKGYVSMLAGWVARRHIETGDKATRAEPYSVQCEIGNVYLVEGPWNTEYLDEICLFPGGSRKDIVDASSGAFGLLIPKGGDLLDSLAGAEVYDRSAPSEERGHLNLVY